MAAEKTKIWVYADWLGLAEPKLIGTLSAQKAKGRKAFSFEYEKGWLQSEPQRLLDPNIGWYSGAQFPVGKENFGVFLDSMPDRWGRTLLKRRAAQQAKKQGLTPPKLYDIDFLLGVFDESRMGALRFKLAPEGAFLDNQKLQSIPPWSSVRELQFAASMIESDADFQTTKKWLAMLIAPGSSLGGARPKANVLDEKGNLWIAKFPSKNDEIDKAAWEFLCYKLAKLAGIEMADSKLEKISGRHHTFFTKRFDRIGNARIHFASAMTMTGNNEEILRAETASYLELAEFLQFAGAQNGKDLAQLWRRIIFNIAVSNTDDHLRNHGFLLEKNGWLLSPAYDLNPSIDKNGLSLNIDLEDNALDFELAKSVGTYFQLDLKQMNEIIEKVMTVVKKWATIAIEIGISRKEQSLMEPAFKKGI